MRTIIRFSLDGDYGSALRNKLAPLLEAQGFVRGTKTATYEHGSIGASDLAQVLGDFWSTVAKHKGKGSLDHFWLYTDEEEIDRANAAAAADLGFVIGGRTAK